MIRDLPLLASNWRSEQTLQEFLAERKVVAIAEIDTRRLTRHLRDHGPLNGCIVSGAELAQLGEEGAIAKAKEFPGLKGMDLAKVVSTQENYAWTEGVWDLVKGHSDAGADKFRVVAYDFGGEGTRRKWRAQGKRRRSDRRGGVGRARRGRGGGTYELSG